MSFDASCESAPLKKKTGTLAIAVLVHALALLMAVKFDRTHFTAVHDQQGPPASLFVNISLPPLVHRPGPGRDAVSTPAPAPSAKVTDALRRAVEVLVIPRAVPDPVRLQLSASSADDMARTNASSSATGEAVPAFVSPAPAAAPGAAIASAAAQGQRIVLHEEPKEIVIQIQSMGMSSATYILGGLAGETADAKAQVFKVEIGQYREIELAIVNQVIEQIRAQYPTEIMWDSKARGDLVRLSMRIKDHDEVMKFLRIELFGKRKTSTY